MREMALSLQISLAMVAFGALTSRRCGCGCAMRYFAGYMSAVLLLAGCSNVQVSEQLADTATLRDNKQAIGFFRLGRPDPSCLQLGVQLGIREGALFQPGQQRKLTQTQVTQVVEMILPPGEYHIVSITCFRARSTLVLSDPHGNGLMRRSFASFTLAAGEIINLGELRLVDKKRTHGVWSSFHEIAVEVSDWALPELERFKSQRPKHYAEMRTRLMHVPQSMPAPEHIPKVCEDARRMQAEGKLQNLPQQCVAVAITPKKS
jgi:hypothetical protein